MREATSATTEVKWFLLPDGSHAIAMIAVKLECSTWPTSSTDTVFGRSDCKDTRFALEARRGLAAPFAARGLEASLAAFLRIKLLSEASSAASKAAGKFDSLAEASAKS